MMMSTSLTAVVLAGLVSAVPAQPTFHTDYAKAFSQAASAQKPIAVFIAHGEAGFARLRPPDLRVQCSRLACSKVIMAARSAGGLSGISPLPSVSGFGAGSASTTGRAALTTRAGSTSSAATAGSTSRPGRRSCAIRAPSPRARRLETTVTITASAHETSMTRPARSL